MDPATSPSRTGYPRPRSGPSWSAKAQAPGSLVEPLILIAALWALVFGALAWWLALERFRSGPLWAVYGMLLGPIALAILQVAPPGRCPSCGGGTVGWESVCLHCDRPFGSARRSALVLVQEGADASAQGARSAASAQPAEAAPAPRRRSRRTKDGAGSVGAAGAGTAAAVSGSAAGAMPRAPHAYPNPSAGPESAASAPTPAPVAPPPVASPPVAPPSVAPPPVAQPAIGAPSPDGAGDASRSAPASDAAGQPAARMGVI
jgi:hypothetical protein